MTLNRKKVPNRKKVWGPLISVRLHQFVCKASMLPTVLSLLPSIFFFCFSIYHRYMRLIFLTMTLLNTILSNSLQISVNLKSLFYSYVYSIVYVYYNLFFQSFAIGRWNWLFILVIVFTGAIKINMHTYVSVLMSLSLGDRYQELELLEYMKL